MRRAESTDPAPKPRDIVFVQQLDDEGFWNNVGESASVKVAIKIAEGWHAENKRKTRVCKGPKRDVVKEIG